MIYRNAVAHAGIEITETGVKATSCRIVDGRVEPGSARQVDVSDAQFGEDVLALHELLVALQVTLLPWLGSHPELSRALAAHTPGPRARAQVLEVVGGTIGLGEINTRATDTHLTIEAVGVGGLDAAGESRVLTMVPAGFGTGTAVTEVTLTLDDRAPVVYHRQELESLSQDPLTVGCMFGLFTAKWLLHSRGHLSDEEQAAWIVLRLTEFHINAIAAGFAEPVDGDNLDAAAASARSVLHRLDEVVPASSRTRLTRQATAQVQVLANDFPALARWYRGRIPPELAEPPIKRVGQSLGANDRARQAALVLTGPAMLEAEPR